jgi:uncharacterized beta-barrel protein YwiB (DUF1934 family)
MKISVLFPQARYEVPSETVDLLEGLSVYFDGEVPADDDSDIVVRLDSGVELHPLFFRYIEAYFEAEPDASTVRVATKDESGEIVGYVVTARNGVVNVEDSFVLSKIFNTTYNISETENALDLKNNEIIKSSESDSEKVELTREILATEDKTSNPETDNI